MSRYNFYSIYVFAPDINQLENILEEFSLYDCFHFHDERKSYITDNYFNIYGFSLGVNVSLPEEIYVSHPNFIFCEFTWGEVGWYSERLINDGKVIVTSNVVSLPEFSNVKNSSYEDMKNLCNKFANNSLVNLAYSVQYINQPLSF